MVPVLLYAEDNRDDRFLIWKILEPWHREIDLRFVQDGAEAIAYLAGDDGFADRRLHPLPQLVALDLNMPRVTGFETLRWIRSQPDFASIPILIASSSSELRDVTQAYDLGASAYLVKPSPFDQFSKAVCAACSFFLRQGVAPK
jgi:CheY-like chemotaxis protein